MDGFRIGHLGSRDDGRHVEVGQRGRSRTDTDGLVGQLDVLGITVGFGVHHHRLDTQLTASALDAQGDLAPVGNQNFLKHEVPRSLVPVPRHRLLPMTQSRSQWLAHLGAAMRTARNAS
ncbi:hypothetical protein SDC9_135225 [bioreactor metagenome]|uniref:Uncharacterized protein n=1 Tax=bioreactor metagenome TaxID=1076179 RepID=A0A645DF92_9ZZZZ